MNAKEMLINTIMEHMGKNYEDAEQYAKLLTNAAYTEYVRIRYEEQHNTYMN